MSVEHGVAEGEPKVVGTCAICGRPLTQVGPNGECLRCLASLGLVAEGEEAEKPRSRGRLTPGPLKYDHFEVEVGRGRFSGGARRRSDGNYLRGARNSVEFYGCAQGY